ncbi:MAG TPA: hypothetical protein VIK01_29150 [Polyangiaceae bacterium]
MLPVASAFGTRSLKLARHSVPSGLGVEVVFVLVYVDSSSQ